MRYVLLGLLVAAPAWANSVNVQLFRSPFNLNYGMLESVVPDNAPWDAHPWDPKYFLSANYNYVKDPLVVIDTTTNTRVRTLVNSVHTLDLAGGYFVQPNLSVFAQLPVNYSNITGQDDKLGLADGRVAAKYVLTDADKPLAIGVMPELVVPTGSATRFLSDDGLGLGLKLLAENEFGSFRLTGHVGFLYSGSATTGGIDYRKRIPIGLGAAIPVARKWLLNLEGSGALALPTAQKQNASEFYGGLSYSPVKYASWLFGLALGAFDRAGSAEVRFQAGYRMYLPEKKHEAEDRRYEIAPPPPEPAPAPPPPPPPKPRAARYVETKKETKIEILEEIPFDNDKDTLKQRGKEILDEVADIIREHDAQLKLLEVEGHTSHTGGYKHNLDLSWRRARTVVAYLVHQQKIPAHLLKAKGYGWSRPQVKPPSAAANRRVEFRIHKKK